MAGVLGACALGVGLGLWARPNLPQDNTAAPPEPPAAEAPRAALQIVVDDEPAPLGELLEVLPPDPRHHNLPPFGARPEPMAPRRPASGLVKVDAPVAVQPLPVVRLEMQPKAETPRSRPSIAEARPRNVEPERRAKVEPRPERKSARAEAAAKPAARPAQDKARLAKARIETAEKKVVAAAKPQLKKLAKAVKAAPKAVEAKAKQVVRKERKAELAEAKTGPKKAPLQKEPLQKAKVEKVKVAKASPPPAKAKARPEPARVQAQKKPAPRGDGPMRVAQAPASRCANADPGEAMVCADSRLGARDRQLQQAYRNAEAAGVPASALRRQQTRWLQARAAAAREAPWAVEDVYVARIAELNDLTQDAREN
ncbi:MAG: hypothetical protein DI570_05270 [Phenylobacterium zucineum]|nr:MAG: hypothetical protein DI570_05270 [Phenylobacterium zucineum]